MTSVELDFCASVDRVPARVSSCCARTQTGLGLQQRQHIAMAEVPLEGQDEHSSYLSHINKISSVSLLLARTPGLQSSFLILLCFSSSARSVFFLQTSVFCVVIISADFKNLTISWLVIKLWSGNDLTQSPCCFTMKNGLSSPFFPPLY